MLFALIGNFGTWEVILILFVALMVFGPGKLPEVAKTIGKTMGDIKRYTSGVQKEFRDAINIDTNSIPTNKEELLKAVLKSEESVPNTAEQKEAATDQAADPDHSEAADTDQVLLDDGKAAKEEADAEP